ncbi:MAG: efflux RND transporter permease subunit [Deltaproteobacteria bacterium]|nr:efflux RND transporter permease subunit [Deltaproteobacteria bacterium]
MIIKDFKLANLVVHNRVTIYFIVAMLVLFGITQYQSTPKEAMPEVDFPYYMVNTIYPGTAAADMENLVTRHIETELMSISGVEALSSQSLQDFSAIFIEFDPGMNKTETYLDVQRAVDKARSKLPTDLLDDPDIQQLEISEFPILNINLSGDVSLPILKTYADDLQEQIEGLTEVTRVDIVGALEREIQVNVDLYKMQAAGLTFRSIEDAIRSENINISGGQIETDGLKVNLRIWGEFQQIDQIANILITDDIYVRDVAQVVDGFKDRESYSRLNGSDVVTLNVIKRGGENLIVAVEKIQGILDKFHETASPSLLITKTGDFSVRTKHSVDNLFNTMLLGFTVVVLVLMFFMGAQNALFAGMAIPLSMLIAFILVPIIGYTMNTVVMIALILVLGILVDNSIVVVENIYRHYSKGLAPDILQASKQAVSEVAMPILGGTLTTMAPFVPLLFWPGIIGRQLYWICASHGTDHTGCIHSRGLHHESCVCRDVYEKKHRAKTASIQSPVTQASHCDSVYIHHLLSHQTISAC